MKWRRVTLVSGDRGLDVLVLVDDGPVETIPCGDR
jgi:hypothetical protein